MWEILETLLSQFQNRLSFPFVISVRQKNICLIKLSKKQTIFRHLSFVSLFLHIIYCLLRLIFVWKSGVPNGNLEIFRIYFLLNLTIIPLAFISVQFFLLVKPIIFPKILNPVKNLLQFALGKLHAFI